MAREIRTVADRNLQVVKHLDTTDPTSPSTHVQRRPSNPHPFPPETEVTTFHSRLQVYLSLGGVLWTVASNGSETKGEKCDHAALPCRGHNKDSQIEHICGRSRVFVAKNARIFFSWWRRQLGIKIRAHLKRWSTRSSLFLTA